MLTNLREKINSFTKILARIISRTGIKPNHITATSLLLSSIAFIEASTARNIPLYVAFVLLSGLCDVLDGALARYIGATTRFGAFLDSTIDRLNDSLMIYALKYFGFNNELVVSTLIVSLMISYTRARAEALDVEMEGIGIIERAERILFIIAIALLSMIDIVYASFLLISLLVLSITTLAQRIFHVYKVLKT